MKTIGYVVTWIDPKILGVVFQLTRSKAGTVIAPRPRSWLTNPNGGPATVFRTRRAAEAAVERSVRYWADGPQNYRIVALRTAP